MTHEPHRWLEAVEARRAYVRDQMRGAGPVLAISRAEGVLLAGIGTGGSKVFEVFDRHAMAALGHTADIERLRQTAIEAAHVDGFTRSSEDVTLRRLVSFSLGPSLKNAFEHLYAPPLIAEAIFAELGDRSERDLLLRLTFDGRQRVATEGCLLAHTEPLSEQEASQWLVRQVATAPDFDHLLRLSRHLLQRLASEPRFSPPDLETDPPALEAGRVFEAALLDRHSATRARYRPLSS